METLPTTFRSPVPLRSPRVSGEVLAWPPLREAVAWAERNRDALNSPRCLWENKSLEVIRAEARREVVERAATYTRWLRGEDSTTDPSVDFTVEKLLFVDGHQPSLFHPGVWVKNFAVSEFARSSAGRSLHLIVDNDLCGGASIKVPAGDRLSPRVANIAYDDNLPPAPWEERAVQNVEKFRAFGSDVAAHLATWNMTPLITALWSDAVASLDRSPKLCDAFTVARHRQERRWGVDNLELPISQMCETESFRSFVLHLLDHLPRFQKIHNEVLAEYRQRNHVRSRTHPVPELKSLGEWVEAPFWIWHAGASQRKQLWIRLSADSMELGDGQQAFLTVPKGESVGKIAERHAALAELSRRGFRLRTRALTTTLFARICLADLFVHGIGGSKYDEMTDEILARFYKLRPPAFFTASATLHLPLKPFPVTPGDLAQRRQQLRELQFHAEKHLDAATCAEANSVSLTHEQAPVSDIAPSKRLECRATIARKQEILNEIAQEAGREVHHSRTHGLAENQTSNSTPALVDDMDCQKCRSERMGDGAQSVTSMREGEPSRKRSDESRRPLSGLTRRQRTARNQKRRQELRQLNQQLATFVTGQQRAIEEEVSQLERELAANLVLKDREFSFALFPAALLEALQLEVASRVDHTAETPR